MDEILTSAEQKIIIMSVLCHPEGLSSLKGVDYAKLAERTGLKSSESARVTFGKARRKLIEFSGAGSDSTKPTPSPTKESPKKVAKPRKKTGGAAAKGKGAKVKKEENEQAEDSKNIPADEEIVVKKEIETGEGGMHGVGDS